MRRLNKTKSGGTSVLDRFNKKPQEVHGSTGQGAPYTGFYHPRKRVASDIVAALKAQGRSSVVDGHPFIAKDGTYLDAADVPFTLLDYFQYWGKTDVAGNLETAWTEARRPGNGIKQCMYTLMLHVPDDGDPFVTVTDLRGTKEPAGSQHAKAIGASETTEFAKANGDLVGKVPPVFRVLSTFAVTPKPGKNYSLANANTSPATAEQVEKILAWAEDEDAQAALGIATQVYEARVESVRKLAE